VCHNAHFVQTRLPIEKYHITVNKMPFNNITALQMQRK